MSSGEQFKEMREIMFKATEKIRIPQKRERKQFSRKLISKPFETGGTAIRPIAYKSGKCWTPAEIDVIFKLQEYLQRQELTLRIRDFVSLWHDQQGKCALTGAEFCITDAWRRHATFDIGIDKIHSKQPFSKKNARLVLLPLSYSKRRSYTSGIRFDDTPVEIDNCVASAVIMHHLRNVLASHKLSKSYAISVQYQKRWGVSHLNPHMVIAHWIFPIYTWYHQNNRSSNLSTICTVDVDAKAQTLTISGHDNDDMFCHDGMRSIYKTFSLCDPSIDYDKVFMDIYDKSFKARLYVDACRYNGLL